MNEIRVGDMVKIRRGAVGDGYRFRVSEIGTGGFGEPVVYGDGYGPVRLADAERYTATMLDVQERLRAEDARENAELRAKLDAALVQRPSSRRKAKS